MVPLVFWCRHVVRRTVRLVLRDDPALAAQESEPHANLITEMMTVHFGNSLTH